MIKVVVTAGQLFYRRIPYFAIASVSLFILFSLGRWSYYQFAPASWFISVHGIPHIDNGQVGSSLTLTFCRTVHHPPIKAVGARGFYLIVGNRQTPVKHYSFDPTFQGNKECQYINLPPDKHPETAGTYLAHTDLTFYVEGHRKVLSYDTNAFVISDTKQSLEQQIRALEDEIRALQGQESSATPTSITFPVSLPPAPTVATTTPQPGAPPASNTTTNQSPSPAPSQPEKGPGVIRALLNSLAGGLL